ncbi:MAG TPA: SDR family oxidoreductase [Galbitalea sp.]|jgi:NAD(P)-dependent dehydrogenase (short-subunit alcohol dehydrogenase family)|nr:SDR family oxidoreductase [Galbitalea sp.]
MAGNAIIIGASRNLGLAIASEFAKRQWNVVGTVREGSAGGFDDLIRSFPGTVRREHLDITRDVEIRELGERLTANSFDLLFVNAGITDADVPVGRVDAETFSRVMVTNALAPMHVVEFLASRVKPQGTIAVMSSRQGSIAMNERGGHEVYRASKSALNQLMRSYAARVAGGHTLLLMHPGWVQTDLGGPGARLTVSDSAPRVVDIVLRHAGEPGLQFRDYTDEVIPW